MKVPLNRPYVDSNVLENLSLAVECDVDFRDECKNRLSEIIGVPKHNLFLCHTCTDALEMAAILCGIKPGDEFITSSFTHPSTVNAFILRGAVPVFSDICWNTLNIDVEKIEKNITEKTKVIVPVHYAGVSCGMDYIRNIASRYNLLVVEDAAQCINSYFRSNHLGTLGDLGAISFHKTKNIQCDEGGLLIVNNEELLDRACKVYEMGTNRNEFNFGTVDKYGWVDVGSSFMMSNTISSILYSNLKKVEEITKYRISIWNRYYNELKGNLFIILPKIPDYAKYHNGHIFYILVSRTYRDEIIKKLNDLGIKADSHFNPLHKSKIYSGNTSLPITEISSKAIIRLPIFYEMTNSQINYIINSLKEIIK